MNTHLTKSMSTGLKSRSAGFTLVELMIGIVLLALLSAIAMPSYNAWMQNTQIRATSESILNGLQRARAEAVKRNISVEFVLGANSAWIVQVPGVEVIESKPSTGTTVSNIVQPAGATTITYDNFGNVAPLGNADGSPMVSQFDLDSTTLAAGESTPLRVMIGAGGSAKMCDPHAPAGSSRAC